MRLTWAGVISGPIKEFAVVKKLLTAMGITLLVAVPAMAQTVVKDPSKVEPGLYKVEPDHTRLLFSVSHFGFTAYYGEINDVSGTLDLKPQKVESSTLTIAAATATLTTKSADLVESLKGPDWLDAAKFPKITFKATKILKTGAGTADITADLTLHGVTKPVTIQARFIGAGLNALSNAYTVGFQATGKIKRSDFGVKTFLPLVGDEVDLIISAAFEKAS